MAETASKDLSSAQTELSKEEQERLTKKRNRTIALIIGGTLLAIILILLLLFWLNPFPAEEPPSQPLEKSDKRSDVLIDYNVPYGSDPQQVFDIYYKASYTDAPVAYIYHSGFQDSSKEDVANKVFIYLDLGYVVVTPNYRILNKTNQTGVRDKATRDISCAQSTFATLASNYNADPTRVLVHSSSFGAYQTTLALYTDEEDWLDECAETVPAEVDGYVGISVFPGAVVDEELDANYDGNLITGPREVRSTLKLKYNDDKAALRLGASTLATKGPSALLIHGDIDDVVYYVRSQELSDKLDELGIENNYVLLEGVGHEAEQEVKEDTLPIIQAFAEYVRDESEFPFQ